MKGLYAAAYKGLLKAAWALPVALVLNWWVWAPLYSAHSRGWDFVLMSVVGVAQMLITPAWITWRLNRRLKKADW